jgi:hypothetical protein
MRQIRRMSPRARPTAGDVPTAAAAVVPGAGDAFDEDAAVSGQRGQSALRVCECYRHIRQAFITLE